MADQQKPFFDPDIDAYQRQINNPVFTNQNPAAKAINEALPKQIIDPDIAAYQQQINNPVYRNSEYNKISPPTDYSKLPALAAKGALEGGRQVLDFFLGPLVNAAAPLARGEISESPYGKLTKKISPDVTAVTPIEAGVERGFEGVAGGALFGRAGIVQSAVSGTVTGLTDNPWLGLATGVATGMNPKYGALRPNTEFGAAQERLKLPGGSIAEATGGNFAKRMYGWLKGSIGGGGNTQRNLERRNEAFAGTVDDQIARMGNASTPREAGIALQTGAQSRLNQMRTQLQDEQTFLDSKRALNEVDPTPLVNAISNIEGRVVDFKNTASSLTSPAFQRFMTQFKTDLANSPTGQIPYAELKIIRTKLGQQIEDSLFANDKMTNAEAKQLYGAATEAMRSAYRGMDQLAFDASALRQKQIYEHMERTIAPIIKENIPEKVFSGATNQMRLGDTKLRETRLQVEQADPAAWNTFASYLLRRMGKDQQGNFSMATYATNWNKLMKESPEIAQTLFSGTPYAQLPQLYQDLATLANAQKNAGIFYNKSESANTLGIIGMFNHAIKGLSYAAALAAETPTVNAIYNVGAHEGISAGAMATHAVAAPAAYLASEYILSKIMTSPGILRWASTDWGGRGNAAAISALRSIPGIEPEAREGVEFLAKFMQDQIGQRPGEQVLNRIQGEKGRGFAKGGYVSPYNTANDNNTLLDRLLGGVTQGLPSMNPMEDPNKGLNPLAPALRPANQNSKIRGFAQGGPVDRASQAAQMLQQALGLSPHQASGAVKYMNINESRLDPNIVNPTSGAYGVAQWLGPRKQALFSKYGPRPSFDQQINHIIDELKGPENKTFKALVNAKNEKEAYDIWGSMFERPGQAALSKAGVNYRPGNIPATSMAANAVGSSSLLDQIMTEPTGASTIDDEIEEQPSQRGMELAQEHVNNAASMGADPLVQAVIHTIWSSADV